MQNIVDHLQKVAHASPGTNPRGSYRLAAALLRRGQIIKVKTNTYKTHPELKKFTEWPFMHAESNCIISHGIDNCAGMEICVVRTLKNGTLNMAKPCEICTALMKKAGIKRIHYTDWDGQLMCSEV
jgi:tRNA(Arg) A34 adenosine deaminase TadA